MKRLLKYSFAAILFVLFLNGSIIETKAQQLTQVINKMEKSRKSLETLKSQITMVNHDSLLDVSDVRKGNLTYLTRKNKSYVRIDWLRPVKEHMIVIEDEYYELYRPMLKEVIKGSIDKAKGKKKMTNALGFMSMSKAELKANYAVKLIQKKQFQVVKRQAKKNG